MSGESKTSSQEIWRPPVIEEITGTDRFIERSKKEPFIPIGLAGAVGVLAYGAFAYKNRGPEFTLSRYLVRLRVLAQGTVLAAILVGVGYSAVKDSFKPAIKTTTKN